MKNKGLIIGLSVTLAAVLAVFAAIWYFAQPDVAEGSKEIYVTVVFADKSEKDYTVNTDAEFLADALLEEKIITEKSTDGLYTVIAGQRADYNLDKSWWCLTKGGEAVNVGLNDQPIKDGDKFEITNTPA